MKDPVCKMDVEENSEFRSTYKGKTYVFCSANCKQKFDKNPESYTRS